jgi:hypothetical protein
MVSVFAPILYVIASFAAKPLPLITPVSPTVPDVKGAPDDVDKEIFGVTEKVA